MFSPTKVDTVVHALWKAVDGLAAVRDWHNIRVEDARAQLEESTAERDRAVRIHNKLRELLE